MAKKINKQLWEMNPKEIQNYYAKNSPEFVSPGIDFFGFVEGPLVQKVQQKENING